jgi:tetratricopeptide (TPR) repeat protein
MAISRLPTGLVRLGAPAPEAALRHEEARLGRPLPGTYREFLKAFGGVELFHESVVIAGVGPDAALTLEALHERAPTPAPASRPELPFAASVGGETYTLVEEDGGEARVFRIGEDGEERWLAGASLPAWLDAMVAREQLLFDAEGEFREEAFEPDGELTPLFALRQAERALKKDPGAATHHHDLGLACRRLGREERAVEAFATAAALDPENPWPWFDLGRVRLTQGQAPAAVEAFERAARAARGAEAARLWAWTARAALDAGAAETLARAQAAALESAPTLPAELERAAAAAEADGDEDAAAEARELAAAFAAGATARRRLPVLQGPPEPAGPAPRLAPTPTPTPTPRGARGKPSPPPRGPAKTRAGRRPDRSGGGKRR